MSLQMSILLAALLIFSKLAHSAQPDISTDVKTPESKVVKLALEKSVGRIIQVSTYKNSIVAISSCTATLVDKDVILTAAHCVRAKTNIPATSSEEMYFDIPGLTSSLEITTIDGARLQSYLTNLPRITDYVVSAYHREKPLTIYASHAAPLATEYIETQNRDPKLVATDYAYARLSKSIENSIPLSIASHINNSTTYIAGFGGMQLNNSMQIFTCTSGPSVIDPIIQIKTSEQKSLEADISHLTPEQQSKQEPFALYEINNLIADIAILNNYKQNSIASHCNGIVIGGFSGGPVITYIDGHAVIIGVTVQVENTDTVNSSSLTIGAKASSAAHSQIHEHLK